MNRGFAVLSIIGKDRVGMVDDIAAFLETMACNIEESRMSVLGGEFAGILLISGPEDTIRNIGKEADDAGKRLNIRIEVRPTGVETPAVKGLPYLVETVSLDAPGIVHAVTDVLRRRGINIEDLETETKAAPWTGAPTFHMKAHVIIPPGTSVSDLREELARLEEERDIHIDLRPVR